VLLAVVAVAGACLGAGLASAGPAHAVTLTSPERHLLTLVNATRAAHGLPTLRVVACLERAARAHSRQMAARGFFSHASYNGETFAARLVRLGYTNDGYWNWTVGEDIAYGSGSHGTATAIFKAWMHSAPHRAIILTRRFRDAGVGRACGTYSGVAGVVFFTLDCGARSK
jgi:uncharacterized protein YkwD